MLINIETVKIETKQDYIDYCKNKGLVNSPRNFGSVWVDIDNAKSIDANIFINETDYIDQEPLSYPCILVWCETNDMIFGSFVYPNDFNK